MIKALCAILLAVTVLYYCGNFYSKPDMVTKNLNDSYDYIIVGAGSAGSVLAARLAERKDISVLLLEAGGHHEEIDTSHVPALWVGMLHTHFDWEYYTEPQDNACLGLKNRQVYWPRGKTLGGSSVTNVVMYTRGSRFDYDKWERLGCTGWSYQDVLPYFKKSEDILVPELADSEYHGKGGPIGVSSGKVTDLHDLYMQAGQEMGYNIIDYNGQTQDGFSTYQVTIRDGVRSSTSKSFLEPASTKPNLHIGTRSFVSKIGFKNKVANGVFVIRNNRKYFIKAKKEVIVSGGAVNSPQLLMLSGIGPRNHLEEHGIPLVADLPVGQNLQDHARIFTITSIEKPLTYKADFHTSFWYKLLYKLFKAGPLAKSMGEVTSFLYTDEKNRNETHPNVQMNIFSLAGQINIVDFLDNLHLELNRNTKEYGFFTDLIMNHPKSRGTITLRSKDPFDYPKIDPKYLSEKSDLEDFIKAIRLMEKFMNTTTIKSLGVDIEHMNVSVCKDHNFRSDAYWECYVRHFITTTYHPCCSCKMGATTDPTAVVDSSLRVRGLKNLRVVDASVFPEETSGNLNAPTIMVAEKAADIILKEVVIGREIDLFLKAA